MTHLRHNWILNLSATLPPQVFCPGCGAQFRPANQQMRYIGKVPEKYAEVYLP
jgi:hypothetical protein